ncbi:SDR family NAD(P)-dependent oxidoreductase [Curvibacter sp. APW13]|uniref:SDR family NAD(P)-dependent oxidoreductase n=1 Tax=Curvibacter sp. APW13 TaxID=3077236 RepID=UPI0028DEC2CD|nr:SDR family NAD(P)-dependent oxidoreductase [Curvibacter sp. APW13]MDT8991904.1 SDR family NAD(P)-dependent oxidoreductase [Curvibacter sp. APW13]
MNTPKPLTILTGASRGMGLAMARELLVRGGTLLCISRQTSPELDMLAKAHGTELIQWKHDLAQPEAVAAALQAWLDWQDGSGFSSATLINNAGVIPPLVPLERARASDTAQALRVGLEAPMVLTSAFLAATANWHATRRVLNISSGLGRRAMASQAAYCAAKAGMDHFTRCLALDQAHSANPARVCSLAPGVIDTDMQVQLRSTDPAGFPDQASFAHLHANGQLSSPTQAAQRVLAYLERKDFGNEPVADIRDH